MCPGSKAGSLLRLLAEDDWEEAGIDDIAGVPMDDFEQILQAWQYCSDPDGAAFEEHEFINGILDASPGPVLMASARAFRQACKITCGLALSRDIIEVRTMEAEARTDAYIQSAASSSHQTPVVIQTPAPVGRTVNLAHLRSRVLLLSSMC